MPFYFEQYQFMVALAENRVSYLNPIFLFLNYFDTYYFNLVLIPLLWLGISSRWGLRMYFLLQFNFIFNSLCKALVGWPRPCTDIPDSGLICFSTPGFPSGAAQTSMLVGALLIYFWKSKYAWPLASAYVLLISFSRLYLGVHYPIDILGGWVIGLSLFFLFIKFINPIERYLETKSLYFSCSLIFLLPLLFMILFPHQVQHYQWSAIAVTIGVFISLRYNLYLKPAGKTWVGFYRGGIAALVNVLIYVGLNEFVPLPITLIFSDLWVCLIASPLLLALPTKAIEKLGRV